MECDKYKTLEVWTSVHNILQTRADADIDKINEVIGFQIGRIVGAFILDTQPLYE